MPDIFLELVKDLTDFAAGRRVLSPAVGPSGEAMLLLAQDAQAQVLLGHEVRPGWASFPHSRAESPVATEIVIASPGRPADLVRFERWGAQLWDYTPPTGLGPIDDCCALNVTEAATWAYYYSDFPLVCIDSGDATRVWRTEVRGASALAVDGTKILFAGGYAADAGRVVLATLAPGRLEVRTACRLLLPSGEPLMRGIKIGRGPVMHVFSEKAWYQVNVGTPNGTR